MQKFEECQECENYGDDEICDQCFDGDLFEEVVEQLDFTEFVKEYAPTAKRKAA